MPRIINTHVIELDGDRSLVLDILDNDTVEVTVELSETECYGLDVPKGLFVNAMALFLRRLGD